MQIFSLIIFIIKVDTLCADAISYERGPKRDLTGSPLIHLLNVCRLQDYHHFGTQCLHVPDPVLPPAKNFNARESQLEFQHFLRYIVYFRRESG